MFKEKLTGLKTICAVIATAGMILVSGVTDGESLRTGNLQGVFQGLGAAACYAAVIILNKKISGADAYQKTTIQLLSAGAVMLPYLFLNEGFGGIRFSPSSIILLLVVGIVHTGFAYVLYFESMERMRAQSVAMLSYIDPVTALLISGVILREPVRIGGIIGAVMIIGSAIASELRTERKDCR